MKKLLYYVIYGLWYTLSLLPLRVLYGLSNVLFFLIFHVLHYRRRTVWVNIVTSFPEREPEDHKKIERQFYHWFCDYIVESIKLLTMSADEMKRRMVFRGTEKIEQCLGNGQSCALYLGHYCNWEWVTSFPLWLSHEQVQCGQLYHPIENEAFDRLFLAVRQRFRSVCIPMNESIRHIMAYKSQNKPVVIGYIADQAPFWWNIHHWSPFLHHDTAVLTGTERIVRKLNHAVFYVDMRRTRRGYYEAEFVPMTLDPSSLPEFQLTDDYFQHLQRSICRHPETYLWTHDRWKRTRERFNRRFEVVDGKVRERETVSDY